jgi:hypothetical protein
MVSAAAVYHQRLETEGTVLKQVLLIVFFFKVTNKLVLFKESYAIKHIKTLVLLTVTNA